MTLIVSTIEEKRVIQVSDTRLTLADGSMYDDDAVKTIVVTCKDAVFSIAYTGLAEVIGKESIRTISGETTLLGAKLRLGCLRQRNGVIALTTDTWISGLLEAIDAPLLTRFEISSLLRKSAEELFAEIRMLSCIPESRLALTMQMTGFEHGFPFCVVISNMRNEHSYFSSPSNQFFSSYLGSAESKTFVGNQFMPEGAILALEGTVDRRISRTMKDMVFQDDKTAVDRWSGLVRGATRHPKYGKLIGRKTLATVISPDGQFQSWSVAPGGRSKVLTPHIVAEGISLVDQTIEIKYEDGSSDSATWTSGIETLSIDSI